MAFDVVCVLDRLNDVPVQLLVHQRAVVGEDGPSVRDGVIDRGKAFGEGFVAGEREGDVVVQSDISRGITQDLVHDFCK